MIHRLGGFELNDDPGRIDVDRVWTFMSEHAYWARWRTREDVEKQVRGAWRVVGAYGDTGELIGFARAVSDGVAFAYLADLYVDPAVRGRGLGKELVRVMIDAGPGADFRWALHTADAHSLYERFGFVRPDHTYLERPAAHSATPAQPAQGGRPETHHHSTSTTETGR